MPEQNRDAIERHPGEQELDRERVAKAISFGISLGGIAGLDILRSSSFALDYRRQKIIFGPITASEKVVRFETGPSREC